MSDEARAHYDRGIALFTAKDYAGAIRELEAGYALDARREFLFAEAQALRLQGDCKRAVPLYQQFLASEPTAVQVNATQIALGRCAQQLAADAAAAAAASPPGKEAKTPGRTATATGTPTLTPTSTTTSPPTGTASGVGGGPVEATPPYKDQLGGVLLGAGVVGLGVGTGFLLGVLSARDDAGRATTYPEFDRRWQTVESRRDIAVVALVAGGALTGAALLRYVQLARREHARAPEPARRQGSPAPSPPPTLTVSKPALSALGAWVVPGAGGVTAIGLGGRF